MPNPYWDDQDRNKSSHRNPQQDEYRRGDAPFQFPMWLIILCFCLTMWPVAIGMIVLNSLLRSGQLSWNSARRLQNQARDAWQHRRVTQAPNQPAYTAQAAGKANPAENKPAEANKPAARPEKQSDTTERVLMIVGAAVGALGLLVTVSGLSDMIFYGGWEYGYLYIEDVVAGLIPLLAGGGMCIGAHLLKTGRRMRKKIDNIVGDDDYMYIKDIAGAIPCSYDKCCRYLEDCIDKGVFGDEAYLDMRTRCLVVRGDPPKPEPKPKRKAKAKAETSEPADPHAQTLARLHALRGSIRDEEMSQKIARLEAVTEKIFAQAKSDPDKRPQMRKFLDYYLPTVVKLLEAYAEMEAQGVEGENIRESKRRIEDAMDTLVTAFENQLDKLFESDALDLSTDIDVMERMLRADGLTETDSPFNLKTPEAPEGPSLHL